MPPLFCTVLAALLYAVFGLYPFGDGLLCWGDMNQQVMPLLLEYKNILCGKANMFYDLQAAGGSSFYGVYLFFLSSPFSLLSLLVPTANMQNMMNVFVAVRIIFVSFTAGIFFNRVFGDLSNAAKTLLSLMYAFSAYMFFYYQNIVWLDMMALFPLFLLGLGALLRGKTAWGYTAALCCAMLINFYLSYMLVLFTVICAAAYLFICCEKSLRGKIAAKFVCHSFLAAAVTAVIWLPALLQYSSSARGVSVTESLEYSQFFAPIESTLPMVISTAVILACLPFLMIKRNIDNKYTFCLFIVFALMFLPLIIEPINKMWHTGSYQCFPARYGYIPCFLGLCITAVILRDTEKNRKTECKNDIRRFSLCTTALLTAGFVAFTAIIILNKNSYESIISYSRSLWASYRQFIYTALVSFFAAACYAAWLLCRKISAANKGVFMLGLTAVFLCEAFFGTAAFMSATVSNPNTFAAAAEISEKITDDGFYRVKTDGKIFDVNLLGGIGYPNMGHYTSMTNADYMRMAKKLGYSSYWMEVGAYGGTLFGDALLGNKYTVSLDFNTKPYTVPVYRTQYYTIYKNTQSFKNAFFVKDSAALSRASEPENRFEIQNNIYKAVLGTDENLFTEYKPKNIGAVDIIYSQTGGAQLVRTAQTNNFILYKIDVQGAQTLYFDCFANPESAELGEHTYDSFDIYVNGVCIQTNYPNQRSNGIVELGRFNNETVKVTLILRKSVSAQSFGVYGMNMRLYEIASSADGVDIKACGNTFKLSYTAETDGKLVLPLFANGDITLTVNGEKKQYETVLEDMLAVPVQKGENEISLCFLPSGFKLGAAVSACGAAALCVVGGVGFARRKKQTEISAPRFEKLCFASLTLLAAAVIAAVYVLPVIIMLYGRYG